MKSQVNFDALGGGKTQYKYEYLNTPTTAKVPVGFVPKQLLVTYKFSPSSIHEYYYDESVSTTQVQWTTNGGTPSMVTMDDSGNSVIRSINPDGSFTLASVYVSSSYVSTMAYLAIG